MKRIIDIHASFWKKDHVGSLVSAFVIAAVAAVIQIAADRYVSGIEGVYVQDLILSNIPTLDLGFFVVQGAIIVSLLGIIVFTLKPKYLLFSVKALCLFIIVRSFFISLTHLGVDPNQLAFDTDSVGFGLYDAIFNSKGDYFFSGHTGIPFLLSLIMWKEKIWRYVFMLSSVVLGVSVLLGHLHYSIDVFAAPFMTYAIFALAKEFFKKDYKLIT